MSLSSLSLFPGQARVHKASQGGEGQLEGKTTALHLAKSFLSPRSVLRGLWKVEGSLHRFRGKVPLQETRKDGVDKVGDMEPLGFAGDRAALESREGEQESLCWSLVRALPSPEDVDDLQPSKH